MSGAASFAGADVGYDPAKKAKESTPRKLARVGLLVAGVAAASSAATQYVAHEAMYHRLLGPPVAGRVYAPWKWVEWMGEPWANDPGQAKPVFDKVKGAFGLVTVLGLFAAVRISTMRRRKPKRHEGVHGTAGFVQSAAEIREMGLLPPVKPPGGEGRKVGVVVGGWTDPATGEMRYLTHSGAEHCLAIAPTRSGKGVGLVLPTLLSCPSSVVVYDPKAELWGMTAGWRQRYADNAVLLFEPGGLSGSCGFNALEEVRLETAYEVSDAQNISLNLVDPDGKGMDGDHWKKTSFALLTGLILHECYKARDKGDVASLTDVAAALADPEGTAALWQDMVGNAWGIDGTVHQQVAMAGQDMLDREDRERGSVLSTAKTYLELFRDPIVARNTRRSDFRIADLMNHDRPVSLYVQVSGTDSVRLRPLVRLLMTMIARGLMGVKLEIAGGRTRSPHKHDLLMMLDEFPTLGRLEVVESALAVCAGYGIKFYLIIQDKQQLLKTYTQYESIVSNCHVRAGYAPNEEATARWWSEMLGTTTVVKEDISESGQKFGSLKNISRTFHEVNRPLRTKDEVMRLRSPTKEGNDIVAPGEMLVMVAGRRPILGTQPLYYKDPVFLRRSLVPAPATDRLATISSSRALRRVG